MTGDKRQFLSLKEFKGGSVTLGDNTSYRIVGKRIVTLNNEKVKAQYVLFVKGSK